MYSLEFILHINNVSISMLQKAIADFGHDLEIAACRGHSGKGMNLQISINTDTPAAIFDTCAQFGRLKSVKINECKAGEKCIL